MFFLKLINFKGFVIYFVFWSIWSNKEFLLDNILGILILNIVKYDIMFYI